MKPDDAKALARAHNKARWGLRVRRIIFHIVVWSSLLLLIAWAVRS